MCAATPGGARLRHPDVEMRTGCDGSLPRACKE